METFHLFFEKLLERAAKAAVKSLNMGQLAFGGQSGGEGKGKFGPIFRCVKAVAEEPAKAYEKGAGKPHDACGLACAHLLFFRGETCQENHFLEAGAVGAGVAAVFTLITSTLKISVELPGMFWPDPRSP